MKSIASIAVLSMLSPGLGAQGAAPKATPAPSPAQIMEAKLAGVDVPVPTRKKYVAPEYPADAAASGIRGIVILEVLISEDGTVQNAKVTRSILGLDEAAVAAVKLWEYEPTRQNGRPVKVLLSQSITFALRLPDLQRALGVPELKSGGAPNVPASVTDHQTASVMVGLGSQGEVKEAAVLDGNPALSEALLRAVRVWRFLVPEGAPPQTFTVRADWTPGPPPVLVLKADDPKTLAAAAAAAANSTPASALASPGTAERPADQAPVATTVLPGAAPAPSATPVAIDTDVLTARPEAPVKEQGVSTVADVILGDNIPDLVKGRRPIWPPLARLGNVTGEVVVRFSVDLAGKVTVHSAEGPDLLKASGEQAVGTWLFRRTAIDRLHLIATFKFGGDRSVAKVERQP